jgi:hypothetical protein
VERGGNAAWRGSDGGGDAVWRGAAAVWGGEGRAGVATRHIEREGQGGDEAWKKKRGGGAMRGRGSTSDKRESTSDKREREHQRREGEAVTTLSGQEEGDSGDVARRSGSGGDAEERGRRRDRNPPARI